MDKMMKKVLWMLKALLGAYLVTSLLLLGLSFLLYKFSLNENAVTAGIVAVYIVSTFVGGFLIGKMAREKKFLWGLLAGFFYYLLLVLISFGLYHSMQGSGMNLVTAAILCMGGGMIGGMLS
ncbi:MAG: TIGR04086 family membrane protein [Hespellia sp.]|nr:TIGR04086 family membrane protein [Hespellia sp.]